MGCQHTMRCANYYQLYSYWHCQKCCLMIFPFSVFNPLNAKLNPICHLLALLGGHHILYVSRVRVKFTLIGLNLGGLRRRKREKMCLQPFRFRDIFNRDLKVYSQRSSSEKVYFKVHLTVLIN